MPPLKLTFAVAPPALAFLVGQAAMQSASAQPAMDIPSVPTLYPTYTHQPTGPTFSPTKQPTLSPTCSGNKGKCIDNGTPYELGFALGMVGVLCCIGILVSAIGRRFRGQKVDPETGLPAKRAPKGVPDKKSWARVVPQFPPIGPPPMPPPPMMPTDPPVKNIPMDVNTPFGWKRKQGDSLIITAVLPGKQAEKVGIKIGWQIVAVDGVEVSSAADFDAEIKEAKGKASQSNVSNEVEITFTVVTENTKDGMKSPKSGQNAPALGGLAEGKEEEEEEEKKEEDDGVKKEEEDDVKQQDGEEEKKEEEPKGEPKGEPKKEEVGEGGATPAAVPAVEEKESSPPPVAAEAVKPKEGEGEGASEAEPAKEAPAEAQGDAAAADQATVAAEAKKEAEPAVAEDGKPKEGFPPADAKAAADPPADAKAAANPPADAKAAEAPAEEAPAEVAPAEVAPAEEAPAEEAPAEEAPAEEAPAEEAAAPAEEAAPSAEES